MATASATALADFSSLSIVRRIALQAAFANRSLMTESLNTFSPNGSFDGVSEKFGGFSTGL
jgi:hypothetical protein